MAIDDDVEILPAQSPANERGSGTFISDRAMVDIHHA